VTDKPLHVRVAEAIRGADFYIPVEGAEIGKMMPTLGHRVPPRAAREGDFWFEAGNEIVMVPRYDSDWSATGPLIERLDITLSREPDPDRDYWEARAHASSVKAKADSPLQSVCYLILELAKQGKLHPNV
jgi:hypothetical protein